MAAVVDYLAGRVERALADQGIDPSSLGEETRQEADDLAVAFAARLAARRQWDALLGALATHAQLLDLTGWTRQNLSLAVKDHRVLKLRRHHGTPVYPLDQLTRTQPARPLPGLRDLLRIWAESDLDPTGWGVASWLHTAQPELGGATPIAELASGAGQETHRFAALTALAGQATARLAA